MMNKYTPQTAQFLILYVILFTLGVLLEDRFPFHLSVPFQYRQNTEDSEPPQVLRARRPLQGNIKVDVGSRSPTKKLPKTKHAHVKNVIFTKNKSTSIDDGTNKKINSMDDTNMVISNNNEVSSTSLQDKFLVKEDTHEVKLSPELNAFDELVNLLTAPRTHCQAVDSRVRPETDSSRDFRYHCSVYRFRQCTRRSINKRFGRRCSRHPRPGYHINTINAHPDGTNISQGKNQQHTQRFVTVNTRTSDLIIPTLQGETQERIWEEKLPAEEESAAPYQHTVTVDAHYSFLQKLRSLGTSHGSVRLDIILDLAGLNSIHKYEVVLKLLQILRWCLIQQGYMLVRSSTESAQLLRYLHQEGLQKPLQILTLWQLNK